MDVRTVVKERFSVRKFSDRKIEPEKLEAILEAARCAPTAVNYQPQRVYVLESEEALAKVRTITRYHFDAPVVLMVCFDEERAAKAPFFPEGNSGVIDATIVCDEMMLVAWERGIGSCWVCAFDHEAAVRAFDLPPQVRPVALLPIGYAADGRGPSHLHHETRPLGDMVTRL